MIDSGDPAACGWHIRFLPMKCSIERLQQSFSRQDVKTAKKNIFLFLRTWRPLRLCGSPRGISLSTEALFFHSRHYFTGRVPWNTDSTKIELFARSAIPQGSQCGVLISTQAEYDPQGITPRGKSSFIRFPKPKFNGKFQICLVRNFRN